MSTVYHMYPDLYMQKKKKHKWISVILTEKNHSSF